MASTFLQRTAQLRNENPNMTAVEAARQARIESSPTYATNQAQKQINYITRQGSNNIMGSIDSLGGDLGAIESGNPNAPLSNTTTAGTGASTAGELKSGVSSGAITTDTVTGNTNKINAVTPTITSTTPTGNSQGNSSTVTGGGYGTGGTSTITNSNKNGKIEGKTNQVIGDVMSNYDTNKTTDTTQLENTKIAVEANAMEVDTELKRQQYETNQLAIEQDRIQKQKADDDKANLEALQAKEREQNASSVAALQAKNDAAEREMSIQNDIALQSSTAAMGRLGLTLSTAGIATAQKIHTDGLYNLAKLKTEDAYNMSKLQVEVAKVEFDHTTAINKIVNDSAKESYTIRKTLNDNIHSINNSIIDNRLSRVEKINTALDSYQKAVEDNEDNTLKLIKNASTSLDDIVKSMYESLKVKEGYGQDRINNIATNGKWFTMTPAEKIKYEQTAGLPKGTVNSQIKASLGKGIVAKIEGIANLSAGKINGIIDEALKLMDTGAYGMDAAIAVALTNSPEYQTQLKLAEAKKNKVGGSGGSSGDSNKTYSKIMVDSVTNESYNVIFDKGTNQQLSSTKIVVPSTTTTTDISGGISAGLNALKSGGGIGGALVAGGKQLVNGTKTTTTMVPLKPKAQDQQSEYYVK